MNDSTHAQVRATAGLEAIALSEVTGEALSEADLAKITNHDLLAWLFGEDERIDRPILASFKGNPKTVEFGAWAARPWHPDVTADAPDHNNYLALNRYKPQAGTSRADAWYARREINVVSMSGFLADDFHEDWRNVLEPTWVLETSPGNVQVVWALKEPLEGADTTLGRKVGQAIIDKGWSDPAAGSPTTRFMRLPVGVNGKHSPPFHVRLLHFNPSARYTVGELVEGLGLDLKPIKAHAAPPAPERLRGEMGEIQELVESIPVKAMPRKEWMAFMHALRGAVGDRIAEGEALAVHASWNSSEYEVGKTLTAWRTMDLSNVRTGIDALRRMAPKPDPTKAFEDLEEQDEATMSDASRALVHASTREAVQALDAVKQKAALVKRKHAIIGTLPPVAVGTPYLFKGLMHQKSLTVIYGASGAAKTFMAVDMAVHLAAGLPWFGKRAREKSGVIIIANEDAEGVQERLHAAAKHIGVDIAELPINLSLVAANMTKSKEEVTERVKEMRAELKAFCPELRHFVVMYDTMLATWLGMDDNAADGIGAVLEDVRGVQDGGMSVVLLHHTGKDAQRGMRGHSSLFGAADCALLVEYDGLARQYRMVVTKRRRGSVGEELAFELEIVGIGFDEDGEGLNTGVIRPVALREDRAEGVSLSDSQKLALHALERAVAEDGVVHNAGTVHGAHQAVDFETWRKSYYAMKPGETYADRESARKAFMRASEYLLTHGVVGNDKGMVWAQ